MIRSVIAGVGGYLPVQRLTNADLEKKVETSDAWILERTGIRERRIAAPDELTSHLAIRAAQEAMQDAGADPADIQLVVLATTTPDETLPATAVKIQRELGIAGFAFDVQAVCSGFMYALSVADNFIRTGTVKQALVIGAETLSRIVDWSDRNTCILFGDGAGAVVLKAREGAGTVADAGILNIILRSDGRYHDLLKTSGGVSGTQTAGFIQMEGKEVFRHAVNNLSEVSEQVMAAAGVRAAEIDWVIPHQANKRIIDTTVKKLGLPPEKVILTLEEQGNTSAASIPLALDAGVKSGRIRRGDLLLLEAMGGGFTWAGALIRF